MFRRDECRVLLFMVLCVTVASAGCRGKTSGPTPAGDAGTVAQGAAPAPAPAPAPPPPSAPAFDLAPPPGYHPVNAPAPLSAAWEAPPRKNGFTPTLNVARRPLPSGTPDQIYTTWKDELMAVLKKQYLEVKVLNERELPAGPLKGKLIICVVTLKMPEGKKPMPLFTYGATYVTSDSLWVLGAITGAELDVKTGNITPTGEPEILNALASFRLR